MNANKRGLSELIAYVILISIALSLSVFVFAWLRCYLPGSCGSEARECPEGAVLVIKDYSCGADDSGRILNLTIQNRGLFSVDGFIIKVNDRPSSLGVYTIQTSDGKFGRKLSPGENASYSVSLATSVFNGDALISPPISRLTFIEVQPFLKNVDGTRQTNVFCDRVSSQVTDCF